MLAVNREFDGMPRYFFHFVWAEDAVKDEQGVELEGLSAAYWHAIDMVHRVRVKFPDAGNDWLIEIADETDRKPLVVLPWFDGHGLRFRKGRSASDAVDDSSTGT
jgi:hypothetical protein